MRKQRTIVVMAAALAAIIGCESDLSLDVGSPNGEDRFEAIRRRLPITIEPGPMGFGGSGACSVEGCSPEAFRDAVFDAHCGETETKDRTSATGNECAQRVIDAERIVCTAQVLLQIVDSPSTTDLVFEPPALPQFDGLVRVPPQDAESNAELARLALEEAERAVRVAGDAFDAGRTPGCTDALLDDPAGATAALASLSLAEELAHFYAEALDVARAASERAAQSGAAVSDASYSRRTDSAAASADALAPFASRTAAAHMLVGGEVGLPAIDGVAEDGFFTRNRLSARPSGPSS